MNTNANTSENKNNNSHNNDNSIETSAITANNSNTVHMNNNATTSSCTPTAGADVTSSATVLTPMITVVEAGEVASTTTNNNNNTLSLPAPANITTNSTMNEAPTDGDAQNMRLILPVFIQNERKYSQPERQRKIQSSPVKSIRRFSQDSSELLGKHLNVSHPI